MIPFHTIKAAMLSVTAVLFVLTAGGANAAGEGYEAAANLSASEYLADELRQGEHHTVDDVIRNDGYVNYYTVRSRYGVFEAAGLALLRIRIAEVAALAALDELSKTEVFLQAAADAGMGQIRALQQFAANPVETVAGIPAGVGRMFKRFARKTGEVASATKEFVAAEMENPEADVEGADVTEEAEADDESTTEKAIDLTESWFGVSGAERAWAQKLGTDPYTTNETLRAAIKEVAWAERLGKFGMGLTAIPSIPGADIIGEVNSVVWSRDPYELADLNRARLEATGADEALIEQFLDNPRLSPTQKTYLVAAIAELDGVAGRDGILQQSLNPESEAESRFLVESVTMLAWYHHNQRPIVALNTELAIPAALADDRRGVFVFATDYVYWTEDVAEAARNYASTTDAPVKELWLLGRVSDRCRAALASLGFALNEDVAALLVGTDNAGEPAAEEP